MVMEEEKELPIIRKSKIKNDSEEEPTSLMTNQESKHLDSVHNLAQNSIAFSPERSLFIGESTQANSSLFVPNTNS